MSMWVRQGGISDKGLHLGIGFCLCIFNLFSLMGPRVEALMNQIFKCISVTGRNWNIKHRLCSIVLAAIIWGPVLYVFAKESIYTSEFLPFSLAIWFLYISGRGYTSLDWWGQQSTYVWLLGYENCQMLMSVVRVEVSDIRLILFTLRTFLSFFLFYILPLFYKGISTLLG